MIRVFGKMISGRLLILASFDAVLCYAAIIASRNVLHLRFAVPLSSEILDGLPFLLALFSVAAIWTMGFYRPSLRLGHSTGIIGAISASVLAVIFGASVVIMLRFISGFDGSLELRWVAMPLAMCVFAMCLARARFIWSGDLFFLKRNILLIGDGHRAAAVADLANTTNIIIRRQLSLASPQTFGALSPDELRREKIREVVVATEEQRGLPMHPLLDCRLRGIPVVDYLTFCERESGYVDLEALQPSWLIYSEGCRQGLWARFIKRVFDIFASIVLLLAAAPLMAAAALLIALEGRGPIFYRQDRVGLGGRPFTLLKFRSMRTDAETAVAPQWAYKRDPRITRVGALLRPMRLDELPQLINVLRGDMSLIGPRPERPFFVEQLSREIPFYGFRHVIKPGLTGWAQINAPYAASIAETRTKLSYDLYYIKNRSFFLDLRIALSTIRVVLLQEGAV